MASVPHTDVVEPRVGIAHIEVTAADLLAHFDLSGLPSAPVVFTAEDDAWLRAG